MRGEAGQEVKGGELRIRRADDGHFWVDGEVNGRPVRFLVDSGATMTTLTRADGRARRRRAGGGFGVMVETANGTVMVERGRAERLQVGPIEREDLAVHISDDARRHQRDRDELPVEPERLGRGRPHPGAPTVRGPLRSLLFLHNVYYRTLTDGR